MLLPKAVFNRCNILVQGCVDVANVLSDRANVLSDRANVLSDRAQILLHSVDYNALTEISMIWKDLILR
jgi:hypothetical protein